MMMTEKKYGETMPIGVISDIFTPRLQIQYLVRWCYLPLFHGWEGSITLEGNML
jgi:hypothetical protein